MSPDDLLNGLDDLSADELAARAKGLSPSALASNPVKIAPFTCAAGTSIAAGATAEFSITPTRNMIVRQIVLEKAVDGTTNGLQVTGIEFGDERETIAPGNVPGATFKSDSTTELRLGVLPKGVPSTIRVTNQTAAAIDDVAVACIGWTAKG